MDFLQTDYDVNNNKAKVHKSSLVPVSCGTASACKSYVGEYLVKIFRFASVKIFSAMDLLFVF